MGKILKIAVIAIASLAAILVALVFLVPMETYRGPIESAARSATGRDLRINGALALSLYPAIGIKAENVTFANAEGGKGDFMATMESLVVGLELIPLLSGDLRVSELVLTNPVVHLEVDKAGNPNWRFGEAEPAAPSEEGGAIAGLENMSFGDVRISGGSFTYDNFKTGAHETLSNVDLDVELADLDSPLSLDGALDYRSRRVNLDLSADKPRAFMEGGRTPMAVKIGAGDLDASISGTYDAASGAIVGALDMRASSVRGLLGWLGNPMPGDAGFGEMRLKGDLSAAGSMIAIKNAALFFDGMNAAGALTLNTGGNVPSISGSLALDRLDINRYLSGGAGGGHAKAGRAPAGWSDAPLSLAGLRSVAADLKFSADSVVFQRVKTGKAVLALTIKGGVLTATLSQLALYEGSGKATLVANGSAATPSLKASLDFSGIKAMPFLSDALDMTWLEGTGAFKLDVSGSGKSERAIMSSLSGKGSMNFNDGAIKGVNLGLIANTIASALSGNAVGGSAETGFTKFAATFTIRNGVLSNDDLKLTGPHVSMTGKGVVDLGRQTMKFRVEPKAIGTAAAGGEAPSLGIPFVIQGPWSKLSYMPDLENVIGGSINSLLSGKGLEGGIPGLDQLIPGLTGGGQGQGGAGSLIPGLPSIPGVTPQPQQPAPANDAAEPANDADQPPAPAPSADQAPAPAETQEAPAEGTPATDAGSAPAAGATDAVGTPSPKPRRGRRNQPQEDEGEPAPDSETTDTPPAEGG